MRNHTFLISCIVLLIVLAGCGASTDQENAPDKTLQVEIDPDMIARIDLYWNYCSYSVRREDSNSLIGNAIELLNGDYLLYARWINNGTGSGNHIDLYDAEGNIQKSYYIFMSEDGPLSIWEEGTAHFNYRREDGRDNLQEIVKMIAVEHYWIKTP